MDKGQNKKATKIKLKGTVSWVFLNLPFLVFLTFLGSIYIYNSHQVSRSLKKIDKLSTEVNEARWKYLNEKQKVMYGSTASQIEGKVATLKLKRLKKAHGYIADSN